MNDDELLENLVMTNTPDNSNNNQRFSLNWDVIGISAVAVTLLGAAIFYVIGWMYESHWYGFYGIEISQLDLPVYQTMMQAIPSVLILLLVIVISFVLVVAFGVFYRFISHNKPKYVFRTTIYLSYIQYLFLLIIIAEYLPKGIEGFVSKLLLGYSSGALILFIVIFQFYMQSAAMRTFRDRIFRIGLENNIGLMLNSYIKKRINWNAEDSSEIIKVLNILIISAFMSLTMVMSVRLGIYDATHKKRLFSGLWHMRKAFIYTSNDNWPLPGMGIKKGNMNKYGPLNVIYKNEGDLFVTNWDESDVITRSVRLYVISIEDDVYISIGE